MWRMRNLERRRGCNSSPGRGVWGSRGVGRCGSLSEEELCEATAADKTWRSSPQQLSEHYAELAASHWEALRAREAKERENARLQLDNTTLRQESHRLRQENCCLREEYCRLYETIQLGLDAVSDEPATSGVAAEPLRVQLERLQEKHRRALQQLRRCWAAGGLAAWELDDEELDELLEKEEDDDQQPLEKRSLMPAV